MSDVLSTVLGIAEGVASWLDQLQPATWRGLPFEVQASEYRRGRRFALHEYPFRDKPWAEDVGRATRGVGFSGFVVGDDCFQQAQALLAAAEQPGPGTLVHPSLGTMTVALVEPLTASERFELGRVVELRFAFVETGTPLYPSDSTSTQDDVADKAGAAQAASSDDFQGSFQPSSGGPSPNDVGGGDATTYTDGRGTTTSVPIAPTGYHASSGVDVVSSWGGMASDQASAPGVAAAGAVGTMPPDNTTFGRFDGIGSLSFTTPDAAMDNQVQQRDEVNDAGEKAARAALIS